MSIEDDIRDHRSPYVPSGKGAQRARSSQHAKDRNVRIAAIRRAMEARKQAGGTSLPEKKREKEK